MALWDRIRLELDAQIQAQGVQNAYFPLLIPKSFLEKEAQHVEGFAKECAVVTHHRLKLAPVSEKQTEESSQDQLQQQQELVVDPEAQLEEPLIIRPTSETVIWNTFAKWIQSHRDLPLKVNQWANVVRWELRTRPFLRTSEFLWQEGHTAHATADEAIQQAETMISVYANLCQDLLAIPTITGRKSPSERFAGALDTYTIEALMPNGWALQSGTSHFLGQNFGRAFDVTYQDSDGKRQEVWGTSWGVSTRLLGALIMTHSDDAGLVLPPKVAPVQVVIVPIYPTKKKKSVEEEQKLDALKQSVEALAMQCREAGLRVKVDDRDYVRNGAKYFEWERKGVPLRIELGPRDYDQGVCILKYRVGSEEKQTVQLDAAATEAVHGLNQLQQYLYESAHQRLLKGIRHGDTVSYDEMKLALTNDEASVYPGAGLFLVPWKCDETNEAKIKEECKATIRCYPLTNNTNNDVDLQGKVCFYSGEPATHMALFGRAF
jgi:prolyl-tRNA synthetase